jgi:hypothetical protein
MKDSTTISGETKRKTLEQLQEDIIQYLGKGGQIKKIKTGEGAPPITIRKRYWKED